MRDRLVWDEDQLLLAAVMILAYAIGYATPRWTVGLASRARPTPRGPSRALVALPPLICVAFEWTTGLWDGRPGALGTGPLHVALPMLAAGAAAATVFLLLRAVGPREPGAAANLAWGLAAAGLAALALALWRFWPAPTPRMF